MSENISPARLIRAMRDCRKDSGQGYSMDTAARKEAVERGLLVFVQWPAGFWKITDKGYNFIQDNEGE